MKNFSSIVDHKKEAERLLKLFNTANAKPGMPGYTIAKRYALIAIEYVKNESSPSYDYYDMIGKELEKL